MSDSRRLSRARWATRAQFLHLGVIVGVWGVHVPTIKVAYSLDERTLAAVLLATSAGSVLMLFLAGRVVGRMGARNTSVLAGWLFCAALACSLLLPNVWWLLLAMLVLGSGESLYDVAINAEGTTLELLSGRAVMSGFHGMFSLGALAGSGSAAAMIGLLICCAMLAEGVMYNWSVLYVQQELRTPQEGAALAYVSFAGATALMRFAGDAVRTRVSERTMLLSGSWLAATAMCVVLIVARPWVAIVGFALVGVGLATIVPLLYNAATRVPGVSRAAAIASVSSIGYLGFMIGPPIIGGIAHATTLSVAMSTLVVASLLLPIGARRVPLSDGARAREA